MEGVEGDLLRKGGTVESFWLGETLKYFFLLFREDGMVRRSI